jgi:hypothetical protein
VGGSAAKESKLKPPLEVGPIGPAKATGTTDWGSMPEKERERALTLLKEKFPERYREIVEQYMKSLADQAGSKKKP